MTTETSIRAVNEAVETTGGHDTTSLLSVDKLMDVTHKPVLQTPTAMLLIDKHSFIYYYTIIAKTTGKSIIFNNLLPNFIILRLLSDAQRPSEYGPPFLRYQILMKIWDKI